MRTPKKPSKTVRAVHEHPAPYEALPKAAALVVAGDEHPTPWDESPREWGRRGYDQFRAITRAHRRDLFHGTW